MVAAEPDCNEAARSIADTHGPFSISGVKPGGRYRPSFYDTQLVEEIDTLRKAMMDSFTLELSLTSGPVMELSRQLDVKINQYMKQACFHRE